MPEGKHFDAHEDHAIVPIRRKLAYGAGGLGEAILSDAVLSSLYPFYNIILKVDPVLLGWALLFPRFYDAITDPLMGQISDNTRSRWGRRRPYIAAGSILVFLTTILVWSPPESLDPRGLGFYLLALSFVSATAMTITVIPNFSLGAEISFDYNERSRVQAYKGIFTRIGATIGCLAFWFAYLDIFSGPRQGFRVFGIVCAAIALAAFWVVVLGVREEGELQDQERTTLISGTKQVFKNGPFIVLALAAMLFILGVFVALPLSTYLNIYYVHGGDEEGASGLVSLAAATPHLSALLFVPLLAWMSTRFGKKRSFIIGLAVLGVVPLTSWFFYTPEHPYLQLVYASLLGFGIAAWLVLPTSMMADVCDLDELRTGKRREGAYFGYFTFLFKAGFSLTGLINGLCLSYAGFDQNLPAQSPDTIRNLRLIMMFAPAVIILLGAGVVAFYPLGPERVREIRETLEARRRARLAEAGQS